MHDEFFLEIAPMTVPTDNQLRDFAQTLGHRLYARSARFAAAESCTGGWIAKTVTDLPGASEWFDCSVVTYSDAAKRALLDVSGETLDRYGAVSRETALEMVEGLLTNSAADIAVAVTGIAGPSGGSADKPVGTVWIAWSWRGLNARSQVFQFYGDRDAVRRQTVEAALHGLVALLA